MYKFFRIAARLFVRDRTSGPFCRACTLPLVVLATIMIAPLNASAELWRFDPSASVRLTYDDNPELNVANQNSVTSTVVTGAVALSSLTETREVRGFLKAQAFTYSGHDDDLDDHSNLLAGIEYDLKQILSKWSVDASLRRDTILRDIDLIENPGDVTIEPDDDIDDSSVQQTVKRNRIVFKPGWSKSLTELTGIRLRYRFNQVDYDDAAGTGLVEYEDNTFTGEYFRSISERDEFAGSLEYVNYKAADANREYDGISVEAVYRRKFDETTDGELRVGVFETDYKTTTSSGTEDGFLIGLEGTKRTGLTRYGVRLRRKLYPSGSGDLVRTDEAVLNIFREISERTSISLRSRLYENKSLRADNPDANRRYLSFEPRFRWRMAPEWFFDFSYRYVRQNRDTDPESADSNAVTFSVTFFDKRPLN